MKKMTITVGPDHWRDMEGGELYRLAAEGNSDAQAEIWRREGCCSNCGAPMGRNDQECPACGYV